MQIKFNFPKKHLQINVFLNYPSAQHNISCSNLHILDQKVWDIAVKFFKSLYFDYWGVVKFFTLHIFLPRQTLLNQQIKSWETFHISSAWVETYESPLNTTNEELTLMAVFPHVSWVTGATVPASGNAVAAPVLTTHSGLGQNQGVISFWRYRNRAAVDNCNNHRRHCKSPQSKKN